MYLPKTSGEIPIEKQFVSLRHIKEALSAAFNVQVKEETSHSLSGKVVRFARIYGAPMIWPSATIEIQIDHENDRLQYTFYWPDYYLILLSIVAITTFLIRDPKSLPIEACVVIPIFQFLMIYLDSRYVQSRIRRFLLKTQKAT